MTATTYFIAELFRAANEVDRLSAFESRRLLERAVATIRDLRGEIGIRPSRTRADVVIDLQTIAASTATTPGSAIASALLEAANVIRSLKIILDGKDEA